MTEFKEGQLVFFKGTYKCEIGKIKELKSGNLARVWYHSGDTTSLTALELLYPIANDDCILDLINKDIDRDRDKDCTVGLTGMETKSKKLSISYDDLTTILYCMEQTLNDSTDDEERQEIRQAYHPLLDIWLKEM